MATYSSEQQKIVDEAMSGASASSLSPEAIYYRSYGSFPTATQTQQQTQLNQVAPGYVVDTRDYGAGSTAELVGGESIKTPDYRPLEAGRQTMKEQLAAGTLGKPELTELGSFSKMEEQQVDTSRPSPQTAVAGQGLPGGPGKGGVLGAGEGGGGSLAGAALPSKFEQGFQKALASGTQIPATGAGGAGIVQQYAPTKTNDVASMFVQTDPYIESLVAAWQQFISPQNQRASLVDTYNQMIKDSGIQAIDMELVDMKKVIEGSEDDIRNEVTKAGGFATDSQVLALTNARNKQLIKNYNTLLDTRNAKEKYLQTAIQLEQADRQAADARFESAFNMGLQIANYHQQMQQNARQQMQWLASNIGFDGLYDSAGGDPYYTSMIERYLGLPTGGLVSAADQARLARTQAEEQRVLDLKEQKLRMDLTSEQIATARKQRSLLGSMETQIVDVGGKKYLVNSQTGDIIKEIAPSGTADDTKRLESLDTINVLDNLQTHSGLNNAVGPSGIFKWLTRMGTLTGTKQSFIGDVQKIVSGMTLDSLISAKERGATFGALSDSEMRILASAATKIGQWAVQKNGQVVGYNTSESSFREELDNISALTKRAYILSGYSPGDVGAIQTPDGKVWIQNHDGSMTQIN